MPGLMRLFVRVEEDTPFCLILADNLLPEHLEQIAVKYFKENCHSTRHVPELILIRRITFRNNDRLFDFIKRKPKVISSVSDMSLMQPGSKSAQLNVYATTFQPETIRQQFVVMNPPRVPGGGLSAIGAYCETELLIKAASIDRLIMKMTDPNGSDFIRDVFFMTYRSFVSPAVVLAKLVDRYDVPPIARIGHAQRSPLDRSYYDDLTLQIRLRVFSVLEHWVDKYYFDFSDDELYRRLRRFVREKIDTDGAPSLITTLMRLRDRTALRDRRPTPLPGTLNRNLLPSQLLATKDPKSIAHQLTLLTLYVHNAIQSPELLGRRWEGPQAVDVPNFIQYRDYINRVSNWVSYCIVSERDPASRVRNMSQLYQLCDELLEIHNWDMLVAVYGGLTDQSVARLTKTAEQMPESSKGLLTKFEELVSFKSSTKVLKATMAASPRPFFPSIVIHLRDLVHLDELPAEVDGLVNFLRCIQQYNLVTFLLDGQHQSLPYESDPEVIAAFSYWHIVDDKTLEELSNDIQRSM